MDHSYHYIANASALIALCEQLSTRRWLALDTEFMRERTYYPRFCLLQVSDGDTIACIDPIECGDLTPLWQLLHDPERVKVLHGGRQDLELLLQQSGALPLPLFDTQIAAALLGQGDQIGYGPLVEAVLGVTLAKEHARTDWCSRPLSAAQLAYAADDVRYLGPLYMQQLAELTRCDRHHWLDDDMTRLSDVASYQNPPEAAWRRVKGGGRLRGAQWEALRRLAAWREEQAQQSNRPRRWIMKDETLLALARELPTTPTALLQLRLERATYERHGVHLLQLLQASESESALPAPTVLPPLNRHQEQLVSQLMQQLRERCEAQQVAMAMVANRRDLERLVRGDRDLPLLRGWRAAVAGDHLLQWLLASEGMAG